MPENENCLEGIKCPKCKSLGPFSIMGKALFKVSDDGTEDFTEVEWKDNNFCECRDCNFRGVVADFKKKESIPPKILALAEKEDSEGMLDDLVHDCLSNDASHINNEGTIKQIRFLRGERGISWNDILEALSDEDLRKDEGGE